MNLTNAALIPLASLIIAALAVFVGPLFSWRIAKKTLATTNRNAVRQMLLPVRQNWLSDLREKLADMLATSLHYFVAGYDDRTDEEYRRLTLLEQQIKFLLDPNDFSHQELVNGVRDTVAALNLTGREGHDKFTDAHINLERISRELVHTEWQRLVSLTVTDEL